MYPGSAGELHSRLHGHRDPRSLGIIVCGTDGATSDYAATGKFYLISLPGIRSQIFFPVELLSVIELLFFNLEAFVKI